MKQFSDRHCQHPILKDDNLFIFALTIYFSIVVILGNN